MTAERLALYAEHPPWGGWENALLLPWQASMTGMEGASGFAYSAGPLLMAFGVLAGLGWGAHSRAARRALRTTAVFAAVGLLGWAAAGRISGLLIQTRLYLVLFPAFSVLAAAGFDGLDNFRWPGVRLGRIAAAISLLVLGLTVYTIASQSSFDKVPTVFLGVEGERQYLERKLGMYFFAMDAIDLLPENARVLMLYEPRSLACTPRCDPDEFLDRWTSDAAASNHDAARVLSEWAAAGYTHLLFHRSGAAFFRDDARFPIEDWLALDALVTRLETVTDLNGVYTLYALP